MILLMIWLGCALLTAVIARSKGRSEIGFLLIGFLFGPLALLGIMLSQPNEEQLTRLGLQHRSLRLCPSCAEAIKVDAIKCRFCGEPAPTISPQAPVVHSEPDTSIPDRLEAAGRAVRQLISSLPI